MINTSRVICGMLCISSMALYCNAQAEWYIGRTPIHNLYKDIARSPKSREEISLAAERLLPMLVGDDRTEVELIVKLLSKRQLQFDQPTKEVPEIRKHIMALHEQRDFEYFKAAEKSAAWHLIRRADAAIPALIDELASTELSRSVVYLDRHGRYHILRVGDCVHGILFQITGRYFSDVMYIHGPNATKTPAEVKDAATRWWRNQQELGVYRNAVGP